MTRVWGSKDFHDAKLQNVDESRYLYSLNFRIQIKSGKFAVYADMPFCVAQDLWKATLWPAIKQQLRQET